MNIQPVVLAGRVVRLEPLALRHLEALSAVGLDPELWRWTASFVDSADKMRTYLETALREQSEGRTLPFATLDLASNTVVGSTRFGNIDVVNRRVEIGWTWLAPQWQRTGINTEAKYLMLTYAFESLSCIRVELKTDALNEQSRRAITRLGAKERNAAQPHDHLQRPRTRFGLFQYSCRRVARGEG
ncbi:MAG: GNAT family N-acetyltransferase [Pyrinomonadaceae bacterium]